MPFKYVAPDDLVWDLKPPEDIFSDTIVFLVGLDLMIDGPAVSDQLIATRFVMGLGDTQGVVEFHLLKGSDKIHATFKKTVKPVEPIKKPYILLTEEEYDALCN